MIPVYGARQRVSTILDDPFDDTAQLVHDLDDPFDDTAQLVHDLPQRVV